jgi:hypothetical protein
MGPYGTGGWATAVPMPNPVPAMAIHTVINRFIGAISCSGWRRAVYGQHKHAAGN